MALEDRIANAPSPARQRLSETELDAAVKGELTNADVRSGSLIAQQRAENIDYYFARPFGNEEDGRSQVVTSDVFDTVEWMMPQLVRIFTSGEEVVRFEPVSEADVAVAEQATDYCNYIWMRDNDGFSNTYTWIKDGLITKNGILKIYWDNWIDKNKETYYALDDASFAMLVNDPEVEVVQHTERQVMAATAPPPVQMGQPPQATPQPQMATVHDVVVQRQEKKGKVCVVPVPPENFVISRDAVSYEGARMVGDKKLVTTSELIEEGFSEEDIEDVGDEASSQFLDSLEAMARNTVETDIREGSGFGRGTRKVWRYEVYMTVDADGDGIAEMWRFVVAGSGYKVLLREPWDGPRPYATWTPIPVTHRFWGISVADTMKDLQLIRSTLWRQGLDGLYLANAPQKEVVAANIIDPAELMTSRIGGIVRVKSAGSINTVGTPSNIEQVLAAIQYVDQSAEDRSGVSARTQGVDDDVLHNTASGQRMLMSQAMQKMELIARVFAETGMKTAFKLIYHLVCKYQDKPRMVQLRGQWVPVDPADWAEQMDTSVSVGLGLGDQDQQLRNAMLIGQAQQTLAQMNMVQPQHALETFKMMCNAVGIKSYSRFAALPDPNAPQKPDPQMAKVQADAQARQMAAQADIALETRKHQDNMALEQAKMQKEASVDAAHASATLELERAKATLEAQLQIMLAQMKNAADIEVARINALKQTASDAYAAEATGIGRQGGMAPVQPVGPQPPMMPPSGMGLPNG